MTFVDMEKAQCGLSRLVSFPPNLTTKPIAVTYIK